MTEQEELQAKAQKAIAAQQAGAKTLSWYLVKNFGLNPKSGQLHASRIIAALGRSDPPLLICLESEIKDE